MDTHKNNLIKDIFIKMFKNPKIKKIIGVILIMIGLLALITPFTPGSWLIFLGLSFFGSHFLLRDKIKIWFRTKYRK